jgi:hypothetical protein
MSNRDCVSALECVLNFGVAAITRSSTSETERHTSLLATCLKNIEVSFGLLHLQVVRVMLR